MASFKSSPSVSFISFILFMFLAISSALDMSIIDYDKKHGLMGLLKRSEKEVKIMFESWLVKNAKNYNALGEKEARFQIFKDNLMFIDEQNAKNHTYTLGLTPFADLTLTEYRSYYTGGALKMSEAGYNISKYVSQVPNGLNQPSSVDWRSANVIGRVRNQGQCQSCWAFAVQECISAKSAIYGYTPFIELSPQQLVDCAPQVHFDNCGPGYPTKTFQWVVDNGGTCRETDYPYRDGQYECDTSTLAKIAVSIDDYGWRQARDENAVKAFVARQPVVVLVASSSRVFQLYKNGIITGNCGGNVDHAVVIIGYGVDNNGTPYWIIKNSWGTIWGEGGFGKILRGYNMCAIGNDVISFPLLN